jgi:hypothetical protein
VTLLCNSFVDPGNNPVINDIASSFSEFKKSFYGLNDNFYKSSAIGNPLIISDGRNRVPVDLLTYLPNCFTLPVASQIKIEDLLTNRREVKSIDEINLINGVELNADDYIKLKNVIQTSIKNVKECKSFTGTEQSLDIKDFMGRFKKGSRPFRRVIENFSQGKIKNSSKATIKTFFRLIRVPVPEETVLNKFNETWAISYYPNKLREFIFKFRNNLLGLNTRVSHFNRNVSQACTFWRISNVDPVPDENFVYIFFECIFIRRVLDRFIDQFLNRLIFLDDLAKKSYFLPV